MTHKRSVPGVAFSSWQHMRSRVRILKKSGYNHMLYNQHNLAVAKIASKEEYKPEIAGVYFTKEKTVATDGYRLLEVSVPIGIKPEEFPVVEGKYAMRGCKPFIVPAKSLKGIKIPTSRSLPILQHVALSHVDDNRVEFMTTDLESGKVTTARRVAGQFPDYEKIIPTGKPVIELEINADYLTELLEVMGKMSKTVKLKIYGIEKPLVLEVKTNEQTARGLLMPYK